MIASATTQRALGTFAQTVAHSGGAMLLQKTSNTNGSVARSEAALASFGKPRLPQTRSVSADTILLEGLRSGNEAAFEEMVRTFGGRLLAIARRYLRSEADACDAVQNAFLCAFKSIDSFNGDSQLSTWLHRIVVNCALMHLPERHRRGEMDQVEIDELLPRFDSNGNWLYDNRPSASAERCIEASETKAIVRESIGMLPDNYRTVVMLRDIEEFDTEQTANLLNLTPSAVKVRLYRAHQALKVC